MTASTTRYSGLIRIVYCFVLLTIAAGCTTTGVIDPNQATIEPNSSVVAFSVNTRKLSEYATPIRPRQLHLQYGTESVPIRLRGGKTGLQRILLEVPAQAVLFSQFELVAGTGIFSDHYLIDNGQSMQLTQGEITYLGRIEIEDVKFEENDDGSPGKPTAVKLVFADALEDDQFAWEQQYKLFQNRVPDKQIVGNWAGGDYYSTLWVKEWTPIYTGHNRGHSRYSGGRPPGPPMGGQQDRQPRNNSSPHN